MDETTVAICGGGPTGLTLALALARHRVKSVVIEKEKSITEDPRGIYLAGDALRILWDLGIREQFKTFSDPIKTVNFHQTSVLNPPFLQADVSGDAFQQTVPNGTAHFQPKLEHALRCEVLKTDFCELREGCELVSREETNDGLNVAYKKDESLHNLKCQWLVGADGKIGVVRKHFLEPTAGIKQETGLFDYEGTWIAANIKVHLPTPESHPQFPLWRLGYTPEAVYNLFWPKGWHFCCPPGKATACGRFGVPSERYWRHEFAEPDFNDSMDPESLLWGQLRPMLRRSADDVLNLTFETPMSFPSDCVEIKRCRHFKFVQKVVNKWFHNRTILIGDAAHVFPPFGGQGIACGTRDAHQLAWRIALLSRLPNVDRALSDELLTAWSRERRQGVDDATLETLINGKLTNEEVILPFTPPSRPGPMFVAERQGYKATADGFYLKEFEGGGKLAQVYMQNQSGSPVLSDSLLKRSDSVMTLLAFSESKEDIVHVRRTLEAAQLHPVVLCPESIVHLQRGESEGEGTSDYLARGYLSEVFRPSSLSQLASHDLLTGYDGTQYFGRFPEGTKYAIVRPDFYIFAVVKTLSELGECLERLRKRLSPHCHGERL